jgi:hypothetical protein
MRKAKRGRLRRGKGKARKEDGKGGGEWEGAAGREREGWKGRRGVVAGKEKNDLGLRMICFILFFKSVRFGPVQSV